MKAVDMAMKQRANIAVIGITGAGKTSVMDAMCGHETVRKERVYYVEEVRELKLEYVEDKVGTVVDPRRLYAARSSGTESLRHRRVSEEINGLVRTALRADPDRILIGEARGGELLELIKALYSGHAGGMFTAHSDDPRDFLYRAELMLAETVSDVRPFRRMLCDVIDRIVLMRRDRRGGGRIVGIYKPRGYNNERSEYVVDCLAGDSLEG